MTAPFPPGVIREDAGGVCVEPMVLRGRRLARDDCNTTFASHQIRSSRGMHGHTNSSREMRSACYHEMRIDQYLHHIKPVVLSDHLRGQKAAVVCITQHVVVHSTAREDHT
jgi:hypothetical protein